MTTQHETPTLFEECRIVRARGELDAQTLASLVRALAEARAARPGRLLLIVDLSEVTFTDCSILTPLCEAWSDCRARGGWMRIVYDNHTTDLVFRQTGLLDRFPAYANAQDAWEGRRTRPVRPAPPGCRHQAARRQPVWPVRAAPTALPMRARNRPLGGHLQNGRLRLGKGRAHLAPPLPMTPCPPRALEYGQQGCAAVLPPDFEPEERARLRRSAASNRPKRRRFPS
ncbi:STAS domain-containing protein [Streptomyces sp. NPDC001982]|uniref:STAS domain-containing protein n=1 Tax=Streptomyces sp. NPDC001982 TaxID=3154405 RepID=UPI00332B82EC